MYCRIVCRPWIWRHAVRLRWPQRGQVTRTLACFFAGIQSSAATAGGGSASDPILAGSGILGTSFVRGGVAVGETLFGLTSVFRRRSRLPQWPAWPSGYRRTIRSCFDVNFLLGSDVPVDLARTTTLVAFDVAVMTAPSPRSECRRSGSRRPVCLQTSSPRRISGCL